MDIRFIPTQGVNFSLTEVFTWMETGMVSQQLTLANEANLAERWEARILANGGMADRARGGVCTGRWTGTAAAACTGSGWMRRDLTT